MEPSSNASKFLSKYQVVRASAALPAAGAWTTPLELVCTESGFMSLSIAYTRGGAGGAFDYMIETSPLATGDVWYQIPLKALGVFAAGVDTNSTIQRELVTYQATAAAIEKLVTGPFEFRSTVERVRVTFRESGAVGTPGTLYATANFSE